MIGRKYNIIGNPGNKETAVQSAAGIVTSINQHCQDGFEGTNNTGFPSMVACGFSSTTPGVLTICEKYKNYPTPGYLKLHGLNTPDNATNDATILSGVRFSGTGQYIAFGSSASLYFHKVSKTTGGALTYIAPATQPGSTKYISWARDDYVATAGAAVDALYVFKRTGDTFNQLTIPLSGSAVYSAEFSPNGDYLAVGMGGSNFVRIYKRTGDTFAFLTNPGSGVSTVRCIRWAPDSSFFVAYTSSAPYTYIYTRSGDTFTRSSVAPDVAITGGTGTSYYMNALTLHKQGNDYYIYYTPNASSTIIVYKYIVNTSLTLQLGLNGGVLPNSGTSYGSAATPDGKYLYVATVGAAYNNAPFTIYRNDSGLITQVSDTITIIGNPGSGTSYSGCALDISPF